MGICGKCGAQVPDGQNCPVCGADSTQMAGQQGSANVAGGYQPTQQGQYGAPPQGQYGAPPQGQYGAPPQGQYGAPPQGQYGAPPQGQYGAPPQGQYGAPPQGQYGAPPQGQYGAPPQGQYGAPQPGHHDPNDLGAKFNKVMDTPDMTGSYHPADIQQNKVMAILAYIGILVLVPIFAAKESPFAKFHANQGLVLCIVEIAYNLVVFILNLILVAITWRLYVIASILRILNIGFLVLAILGIVNASSGRAKQLPIIGKFKILK